MRGFSSVGHRRWLERDLLGPRDLLDGHPLRALLRPIARLQDPWATLVLLGTALGLFGGVVLGAYVAVWAGGSALGSLAGVSLVGLCGGLAAHLSHLR